MPAVLRDDGTLSIECAPAFAPALYDARYIGLKGGRGAGRSHFCAEKLVSRCIERQPTSWACLREVQKSLRFSAKRVVEKKIREFGAQGSFHITDTYIGTPGGGIIIFEGMQNHTIDSIQSLEDFDGAWIEEARSVSVHSLDILRPTIRKNGSEIWFTWNPRFKTDPVDEFFSKMTFNDRGYSKEDDAILIHSNWYDNPWLPEPLRKEKDYDLRHDLDKYAWKWLGQYLKHSEAAVFSNWRVEEFDTPPDARFYHGGDWGFSVDPSVLIRFFIDENTRRLYIDREAYEVGCEIDYLPALFAGDDRWHLPHDPLYWSNPKKYEGIETAHDWPITADSQRPDTISYMQRRGFKIKPALKGKGSVEDGIEFLKNYEIIVHPSCVHTIDELTLYSWKVDKKTEEVLPVLHDKHNHVIDSVRYGAEGIRRRARSMVDYVD